jgi:hypothetical protein
MLHIHNGDSSADTAKQSSLAGEHFAFRESLTTGPTPSGLSDSEWRRIRSKHLSEAYGIDVKECERGLLSQEEILASFSQHEEVVLWFEHDLFCQVHLIYLLNWFSHRALGTTKLSLICIGAFPGKENFRGLGELNHEELASLFPARQQVTDKQMALAVSAWKAYCSSDPGEVESILKIDTSSLTFLKPALQAHLRRFPSTKNGLGLIENSALELIDEGLHGFIDLFHRFGDAEPVYGLGDAQFWLALQRLSMAQKPLLAIVNGNNYGGEKNSENSQQMLTAEIVSKARLELTLLGRSVLNAETDFITLNGIDLWLGGVHLHEKNKVWRWNQEAASLVLPLGEAL